MDWNLTPASMPNPHSATRRYTRAAMIVATMAGMLVAAAPALAGESRVAVAANFREAAIEIGSAFKLATGHSVLFSFGSTGQLYAQIAFGAPFDVFLSADSARVAKTIEEGLAVPGSRFTYATGRIALFSADKNLVAGPETLRDGRFSKLAIAEPSVAPYGAAAVETMRALAAYDVVSNRIVRGLNVAQAYQFVQTGNADLGFVALSQVARHTEGSRWIVPSRLHDPINQDAVMLKRGGGNEAAKAFVTFLAGSEAGAILDTYGYGQEE